MTGEAHGMLALRVGWPSMFRGYLDAPDRYAACFANGGGVRWYLTGDLARRDAEGHFWFVCRADDVIKTAGHLIGPHDVGATVHVGSREHRMGAGPRRTEPRIADAGGAPVADGVQPVQLCRTWW